MSELTHIGDTLLALCGLAVEGKSLIVTLAKYRHIWDLPGREFCMECVEVLSPSAKVVNVVESL